MHKGFFSLRVKWEKSSAFRYRNSVVYVFPKSLTGFARVLYFNS